MKKLSPETGLALFERCPSCRTITLISALERRNWVCPHSKCDHHFLISAQQRISSLADEGQMEIWDDDLTIKDPLGFPGYTTKVSEAIAKTGLHSAAITGLIHISQVPLALGITDYRFMAGAMNSVVGERLARCIEKATQQRLPVLLISGSGGGAMMHEGLISLMQMPRVVSALSRHKRAGLCSICLFTDPTYGGVAASWALLAQVTLAEPKAQIGFVGGRVSGLGLLELSPPYFRTARYQLEKGAIDQIVSRRELKATILNILECSLPSVTAAGLDTLTCASQYHPTKEISCHLDYDQSGTETTVLHDAWDNVQLARNLDRPHSLDYIGKVFDSFFELHGDRCGSDDGAIVGGIARFCTTPVVVIGQEKNRDMREKELRNYGMSGPAGYRKAQRLMQLAEQRKCPLVCLIDTPGADTTVASEDGGISYALAICQETLINLRVPVISIVIGEGGSGGAIALGIADKVLILENSVYSVIAPQGCASIVWKDKTKAKEAAIALKLTAQDALRFGVVDEILAEPPGGAQNDYLYMAHCFSRALAKTLAELSSFSLEELLEKRYERFRKINAFLEM